ncbi:MAG: hypothetical protein LBO05_09195, partial [Deltaproteobacteria bacterium]|nr:hypothetical protein [Deltaproteobacteria bacterium]
TALAVYGATVLSRVLKVASLKKICLGIVLAVYLVLWVRMPGIQDIPIKYYNIISAMPFIYNLSNIKSMLRPNTTVYLDFSEYSKMAIAPLVLKNDKNIKFKFINATSYFTSDPFYSKSVDEDTVIISDTDYQGIFRGEKLLPFNYHLHYYPHERLENNGMAVIYTGKIPYDWKTGDDGGGTLVDVKIPLGLVGRPLRLTLALSLPPGADGEVSDCRKVRVDLLGSGGVSDSYDLLDDNVVLRLPASLTASGVVKFRAYPVDAGCSGNPGPRVYDVLGVYLD